MSAFDAKLNTQVTWQKNDRPVNVGGVFGTLVFAPVFEQDLGQGTVELSKTAATGGQWFLCNNTTYEYNNNPTRRFPSDWNTNIEAEFRQPLLQGAGVQFNRIAGPSAQPGLFLTNGVLLARINVDVSLADFELNVRNFISDVETAYWELHFAYRNLDALIAGPNGALQTWRRIYALFVVSAQGGEAEKEAQAREQYFLFRAAGRKTHEHLIRHRESLALSDGSRAHGRPVDTPVRRADDGALESRLVRPAGRRLARAQNFVARNGRSNSANSN